MREHRSYLKQQSSIPKQPQLCIRRSSASSFPHFGYDLSNGPVPTDTPVILFEAT